MKVGKWTLESADVEGFTLVAPTTFLNATQKEIENKTGGCGPGSIGDWFVPDTVYGESIFLACQSHDLIADPFPHLLDKKWADLTFLVNMTLLVIDDGNTLDVLRLRRVMTYFEAVYFGGDDPFEKGVTMKG